MKCLYASDEDKTEDGVLSGFVDGEIEGVQAIARLRREDSVRFAPTEAPNPSPTDAPFNRSPTDAPTPSPTDASITRLGSPTGPPTDESDGDDSDGGPSCFSSRATVQVKGQGVTPMDELKIGDSVLVGDGTYGKVYSFSHKDSLRKATYIQISTNTMDKPLEISATHMLYANRKLVPAAQVKVGDFVASEQGLPVEVKSIRNVKRRGAYAPLTASGDILVNGIVASNYIEQEAFKSFVSPTTQHWMQHAAFGPYRAFCLLFNCEGETYDAATGHSNGIVMWLHLYNWLQQHSTVVLPAFVYLVAVPGHWMLLNMAYLVVAALGLYIWKINNKKEVTAVNNVEFKKPTEQSPKTKA